MWKKRTDFILELSHYIHMCPVAQSSTRTQVHTYICLHPEGVYGLPGSAVGCHELSKEGALYVLAVPTPLHTPTECIDAWRAEIPLHKGFTSCYVEPCAVLSHQVHSLFSWLLLLVPSTHWAQLLRDCHSWFPASAGRTGMWMRIRDSKLFPYNLAGGQRDTGDPNSMQTPSPM